MKAFLGTVLAIILLWPAPFAGASPGPGANHTFLFASPNQRESLGDEDAKAHLTSIEQVNATAVADRAACTLTQTVEIADSLGIYDKSSENSFILESDLDQKNSEYLGALLGFYSRQEFVLLFFDEANGGDRLWIIKTPQSLDTILATLRKLNLTPVTVRIEKNQNEVWFIDMGEKHGEALKLFVLDVNGHAGVTAGVAELLGNQDRGKAIEGWRKQIRAGEQLSGLHLARELSSKGWRDARAVHTCSKEMSIP